LKTTTAQPAQLPKVQNVQDASYASKVKKGKLMSHPAVQPKGSFVNGNPVQFKHNTGNEVPFRSVVLQAKRNERVLTGIGAAPAKWHPNLAKQNPIITNTGSGVMQMKFAEGVKLELEKYVSDEKTIDKEVPGSIDGSYGFRKRNIIKMLEEEDKEYSLEEAKESYKTILKKQIEQKKRKQN
jgi:hypothetical protein